MLYENTIQEIISATSKFKKFNKGPTLKREASLGHFFCKLKQNLVHGNKCDNLHPSGFPPVRVYGIPKMHKVSFGDPFPKLRLINSNKYTFNHNYARYLCDLFSTLITSEYSGKDTFLVVSQIQSANLGGMLFVY